MAELIAIAYSDERHASEALNAMNRLKGERAIDLQDAVALIKDQEGGVRAEGAKNYTAAGAVSGVVLGTLVGLVLVAPVAGALFGAAAGALSGRLYGVRQIDDFMLELHDNMPNGSSVLLMVVKKADPEKVLAELSQFGGKLIRTTLPDDADERIRAALGSGATGGE